MDSFRRWCVVLIVWSGLTTVLRAADPSSLEVTLNIFSGRPNPVFTVRDAATIRQIVGTFDALPPHPTLTASNPPPVSGLGYGGFQVKGIDGMSWCDVYGNVVQVFMTAPSGAVTARSFRFDQDAVLERLLFAAGRAAGVISFDESPPATVLDAGTRVERSVTISLGNQVVYAVAPRIVAPIAVTAGTRVRFVVAGDPKEADIRWVKDSREVPGTGRTLELAAATSADSGLYWAVVGLGAGSTTTAQAELLVTSREGQRLLNLSVLGRISVEQPVLMGGFTVEPARNGGRTLLLVRAVGPSLATFGVGEPLRAAQLRVLDARGGDVAPANQPFALPTLAEATERAGAFALPNGAGDTARLYYLPAGSFTAQAAAADGGTGSVLLEIFEVPLR